jgi:hypothetical protein
VQYLHADLAIVGMNRIGDLSVAGYIFIGHQLLGIRMSAALCIGANTTCHYKPYAAFGSLAKVGGHAFMAVSYLFQTSVHRAHKNAIL